MSLLLGGSQGAASPILSVDTALRNTGRGRGSVVCLACASGGVFVATSRGYLICYVWDEHGNEKSSEIEVTRQPDHHLSSIFVSPSGSHILVTLTTTTGLVEVHYAQRRWVKTRPLVSLKGILVTSVAWPSCLAYRPGVAEGSLGSSGDSSTGSLVLGTDGGALLEIMIDEKTFQAKKEPAHNVLLPSLRSGGGDGQGDKGPRAICGLAQEILTGGGGIMVLACTPLHLFAFLGGPDLMGLFSKYSFSGRRKIEPLLEAFYPSLRSQLHLYRKGLESAPQRFAWLVGGMVFHGELNLAAGSDDVGSILTNTCTLPLPLVDPGSGSNPDGPSSPSRLQSEQAPHDFEAQYLVMTEYHFIVLSGDMLYAINRVNGKVVAQVGFRSPLTKNVSGEASRSIEGLAKDDVTGSIFLYSDESVMECSVLNERRDLWMVYLEAEGWELALGHCGSNAQRDEVHCRWAEASFNNGDLETAAVHYARIVGGRPAFEEIALKFIDIVQRIDPGGSRGTGMESSPGLKRGKDSSLLGQEALTTFLRTKLEVLSPSDKAQATIVCTWLTELYLDQMNRELLETCGKGSARYRLLEERLRLFLTSDPSLNALDPGTTFGLLSGYGRMEDLVAFAGAKGDHESVLDLLMLNPTLAKKALAVLRKPSCSINLMFKFSPALMSCIPQETVDLFITSRPPLDPGKLIPALIRFGESSSPPEGRLHVLRYIDFAIDQLRCNDGAIHNLCVALLSLDAGEAPLLAYLSRAHDSLSGKPYYDPTQALRLAMERNKPRSCVKLLCSLGMFDAALSLALQIDLELAKSVASLPEDSQSLKRRLWLAVAKHVVQQGAGERQTASIKQAVELLKETGGLIKLEDILPFFPDFVTIDNFKDAICDSLERYNRQIEELKRDMDEATQIAEAARQDLKSLSHRSVALSSDQPCTRCGRSITSPPPLHSGLPSQLGAIQPFYAFLQTGNAYHGTCCAREVMEVSSPSQVATIKDIMTRLSKVPASSQGSNPDLVRTLQEQLVAEIASEDPRNGERAVRRIDMPFTLPREDGLWEI